MQGLNFGPRQSMLNTFSSDDLMELAGNAFNSWCCAAAFLVKETVMGIAQASKGDASHTSSSSSAGSSHDAAMWRTAKSRTLLDILDYGDA